MPMKMLFTRIFCHSGGIVSFYTRKMKTEICQISIRTWQLVPTNLNLKFQVACLIMRKLSVTIGTLHLNIAEFPQKEI